LKVPQMFIGVVQYDLNHMECITVIQKFMDWLIEG
jgi:hypothetical protein